MRIIRNNWLRLLSVVALSITLAACGGSQSGGSPTSAPPSGANRSGTTVNVVASEYAFALDAVQANAGPITFVVTNDGSMPHDFAIDGNGVEQKTALIEPGRTASLTVDLKAGTYDYVCTVPGHATLGMRGTFTVAQ